MTVKLVSQVVIFPYIVLYNLEYKFSSNIMKRTHYYSIGSMLTDEEVHQVWEIVGNALDRNGFVDADGELSIRVYDETLKRNVKVLDKSLL